MKKMTILLCGIFCIAACSSQKNSMNTIEFAGKNILPDDSILLDLQNKNDIVLAAETETFAWAKTSHYQILAKKGNNWMGYVYYVNKTNPAERNNPENFNINPAVVDNPNADSLWQWLMQNDVWKIPGDNGKDFCNGSAGKCNINDAATSRLWILVKDKGINPSYYAPEFFEKCCPGNIHRKLFLQAFEKISALVQSHGSR